jgi:ribosomal protein S27E
MVSEKSLALRGGLGRLMVRCPGCRQVWLAPGLAAGERHACKACGAVFVKRVSAPVRSPRDLPPPPAGQGAG